MPPPVQQFRIDPVNGLYIAIAGQEHLTVRVAFDPVTPRTTGRERPRRQIDAPMDCQGVMGVSFGLVVGGVRQDRDQPPEIGASSY